jgi:hypothetical protein
MVGAMVWVGLVACTREFKRRGRPRRLRDRWACWACLSPFLYTRKDGFLMAMDPCPELSLGTLNTVVFLKGIMEDVRTMGCDALGFEPVEPFCFSSTLFISPS